MSEKILFGQSYFLRFDPKLWAAMQPYPPLGTLYAASYLRERGCEVDLFDAMLAESESEWDAALARSQPRIAVLYEDNFNYLSKMCLLRMREAAFAMIDMARKRGCTVIVAGADATDHTSAYLSAGADYVLIGEGEETLGELIDHLLRRPQATALEAILGLAFERDGQLVITPRRPDLKELDALPFPAWDLVDIDRYRAMWYARHGYYSMNLATSRGCPYHCNWCAKPIWGQRYHVRSPENVVAELAWLKRTYKPDHVWFVDDIFGLIPGWVQRFSELVEQEHARVPFKSLQRVDLILKGDTIAALRRAGAQRIWVGAESGSQKILDAMEKGTQVEHIYQAARRLHAAGIEVGFFLQFGYPGETRQDIERTLQMVRDCRPDDIGMSVSYPMPGTRFFTAVQHELGSKQNWQDSDDLAMLYRGPFNTAFYRWLHKVLHREFRARRAWDELRPALSKPLKLRQHHLHLARSVVYSILALPLLRLELARRARAPHQGLINLVPVEAAPDDLPNMDILLTHAYFLYEDPHELAVMKPYPPLGLLYVNSHLKARGIDSRIFDSTFARFHDMEVYIRREKPPIVGIYSNLMTRTNVLRVVAAARNAGSVVVVGGPDPANYLDEYLSSGVDIIVLGEGELTLEELVPHLQRHGPRQLDRILGVAFRDELGAIVRTEPRPMIADLDAQPFPDRAAIDQNAYVDVWRRHHGKGSVSLITARGCPFTCTWCSHSVFGYSHRRRTPANVVDEVEQIVGTYAPDLLWYADDVFTINHKWLFEYAAEMERRGFRLPFETISREDRLTEEVIQTLARMGCYRLWIGAESGSQKVLDAMKRRTNAERVRSMVHLLQKYGIEVGMFIMLGYEGEERTDLEQTVEHLKLAGPDTFLTTVAYPIKGTPYYASVADRVVARRAWAEGSDRDYTVAGRHSPRYYQFATRWMVSEVAHHRQRHSPRPSYPRLARSFLSAKIGRVGMLLTEREREMA